jgi:hypothetical protein
VVVWASIKLTEALDIIQFLSTESTLLDASAFVVVAFLAGQLVQAEAARRFDQSHRFSIFPKGFPSSYFLLAGQTDENGKPWCSEARRAHYITAASRHNLLDAQQVSLLDKPSGDKGDLSGLSKPVVKRTELPSAF